MLIVLLISLLATAFLFRWLLEENNQNVVLFVESDPKITPPYSFLIIGHGYGAHSDSPYPADSLVAFSDKIREMDVEFIIFPGDIMQHGTELEMDIVKNHLFPKLGKKAFIAPGNGDIVNRKLYEKYFGKTYFSFLHEGDLFIFLDSEMDNGDILGDQLEFALSQIERTKENEGIRNVFIVSHRLVWSMGNPALEAIIPLVNGPAMHPSQSNGFFKNVFPLLKSLKDTPIYLIAGDVGQYWSIPAFYQKDPNFPQITYIATGIGETEKDAIVKVNLSSEGEVTFNHISLFGLSLPRLEENTLEFWINYKNQ
jgi:hypothetical protein